MSEVMPHPDYEYLSHGETKLCEQLDVTERVWRIRYQAAAVRAEDSRAKPKDKTGVEGCAEKKRTKAPARNRSRVSKSSVVG